MRERFKHLAEGCLLVRMRGLEGERFLNLCMAKEIEIWNICSLGECQFEFWTGIGEFRRMRPLARKAGVRLLIKGRRGLPFFFIQESQAKALCGRAECVFSDSVSDVPICLEYLS